MVYQNRLPNNNPCESKDSVLLSHAQAYHQPHPADTQGQLRDQAR